MPSGKFMIVYLIAGLIKKTKHNFIDYTHKMNQYFPKLYEPFGRDINVKVDLSNYATKTDIKNITQLILQALDQKQI